MVVLLDGPDNLNFGGDTPTCDGEEAEAVCRTRAAVSALDGFLKAESDAKVTGDVNITVAWSFAQRSSIAALKKLKGYKKYVEDQAGIYGFQDMQAGVADPS